MESSAARTGLIDAFKARISSEGHERPAPTISGSICAVGGLVVASAFVVLGADKVDGGRSVLGIILMIVLGAGAVAVLTRAPELVHPAGIAALASVSIGLPAFVLIDGDAFPAKTLLLAIAVVSAACFAAPLSRQHPVLLGVALIAFWLLFVAAVDTNVFHTFNDIGPVDDAPSYLSLFVGVAYLGVALQLDRVGLRRIAQPFVAAGDLAFIGGVSAVGSQLGDVGGAVLSIGSGLAMGFIGNRAGRRFTTWVGAAAIGGGVVGLVLAPFDNPSSVNGPGALVAIVGAALPLGVLAWTQFRLRSTIDPVFADSAATEVDFTSFGFSSADAGWYADPSGRFEQRYFDGTEWTEHVFSNGQTARDPITGD